MTRPWILVATREIVVRVLNKGFLIGLAITVLMFVGMTAFFAYQGNEVDDYNVAVITGDADARSAVATAERIAEESDQPIALSVVEVGAAGAAEAALEDETADAWLRTGADAWTVSSWGEPDDDLILVLRAAVRDEVVTSNAAAAGTSMSALEAGSELAVERLDDVERIDDDALDPDIAFFAGVILAVLFFMGAITSGATIAGSVIEEKQSRLVEIIATAVPLRQLLTGKIIGNSAIALGQNLVLVSVGLIGVSFTDATSLLPALSTSLIWFVVFFLVGFVAIAAMYATAGALASRTEDLQNTTLPVTMLLMGTFFMTFMADGTFERVLSYIPPASIVSMPQRILSGDTAWWEPLAALAILLAATAGAVLLCERAYRGALMQTGGRLTWRAALTSADQ